LTELSEIFRKAWEEVLDDWENDKILLQSESDFSHHLFAKCLGMMIKFGMETPYRIHAKESYSPPESTEWYKYPDLVLGEFKVVVEIKFVRWPYASSAKKDRERLMKMMNYKPEIEQIFFTTIFQVTAWTEGVTAWTEGDLQHELKKEGWPNVQWKLLKIGEKNYCALLTSVVRKAPFQ